MLRQALHQSTALILFKMDPNDSKLVHRSVVTHWDLTVSMRLTFAKLSILVSVIIPEGLKSQITSKYNTAAGLRGSLHIIFI